MFDELSPKVSKDQIKNNKLIKSTKAYIHIYIIDRHRLLLNV